MFNLTIRQKRAEKNLSQEELALRSGYSQNYISLLEKGKIRTRHPTLKVIWKIAEVLECCPLTLLECTCNYCDNCKSKN